MNTKKEITTLSTGVVLSIKSVPPMVLSRVYGSLPSEPKPPKFMNNDLGREEENPNDPAYIEAVNEYQLKLADAVTNAIVVLGTSLVSVPTGFPHPYKDYAVWAEPLKIVGIDVPDMKNDSDTGVYNAWVKYVAASTQEDINNLISAVSRLSGVSEDEVAQAANQFRDNA